MRQKVCNICLELLPATDNFFYRQPLNSDGLYNTCIQCRRAKEQERRAAKQAPRLAFEAATNTRLCKNCGPLPFSEFYSLPSLYGQCKKCVQAARRAKKWAGLSDEREVEDKGAVFEEIVPQEIVHVEPLSFRPLMAGLFRAPKPRMRRVA